MDEKANMIGVPIKWQRTDTRAIAWLGQIPVADIALDRGEYLARVGTDWTRAEFHDRFATMEEAVKWVEEKIGA